MPFSRYVDFTFSQDQMESVANLWNQWSILIFFVNAILGAQKSITRCELQVQPFPRSISVLDLIASVMADEATVARWSCECRKGRSPGPIPERAITHKIRDNLDL